MQHCERILDQLPSGVCVYAKDGAISHLNEMGRSIFMLPEKAQPKLIQELFPAIPHLMTSASDRPDSQHVVFALESGQDVHLGMRVRFDRELDHYLVVFQDITKPLKHREQHEEDLAIESICKTVPGLAHEIKNPLTSIFTIVELLLEEDLKGHIHQDLLSIQEEIQRIQGILERYGLNPSLWLSRPIIQHDALDSFWDLWQQTFKNRGLTLNKAWEHDAHMNPDWVKIVLGNLLLNIVESCPAPTQAKVTCDFHDRFVQIEVRDNGPGMDMETLNKASTPFFTTKPNGTGLGLALVRSLVQKAHGSFEIYCPDDGGTTISIQIVKGPQ